MADLEITQGDREYLQVAFTNRAKLPDGHPLKIAGFQSPGWGLRLVVKVSASQGDGEGLMLPANRFTVTSADQAVLELRPADTAALKVTREATSFQYWIQLSNGATTFTAEVGRLRVNKDPVLAPP